MNFTVSALASFFSEASSDEGVRRGSNPFGAVGSLSGLLVRVSFRVRGLGFRV